jgi:hypothetical protein
LLRADRFPLFLALFQLSLSQLLFFHLFFLSTRGVDDARLALLRAVFLRHDDDDDSDDDDDDVS